MNANWNGDVWDVNDWNRDDNRWNQGNRVFSPENYGFLPTLLARGSFLFQAFLPAADLARYFLHALGEFCVSGIFE